MTRLFISIQTVSVKYLHTCRMQRLVFISAQIRSASARDCLRQLMRLLRTRLYVLQTGVLNEILSEAVAMQQPPSDRGKRLKIFYMTQVAVKPPTFVIFVNDKELMHFSYTRYIENKDQRCVWFPGNFPEIYYP